MPKARSEMAKAGSQRDEDDSVDRLITEAASLYGYANLKDEQKKVLKSFVEGKDVFVVVSQARPSHFAAFSSFSSSFQLSRLLFVDR